MGWKEEIKGEAGRLRPDRVFVLTDETVARVAALTDEAVVRMFDCPGRRIVVPAGERSKGTECLLEVWRALTQGGATRRSLLVNVGGGVVTDLGGFAAATFKRGIRHINVPTTLLGMADAAIGGKTGIDFQGYKNEIGAFKMPERVIVDSTWLRTLSAAQMADGYAEVVKSAMLDSEREYGHLLALQGPLMADNVGPAAEWAANFKQDIVTRDPMEQGLRRILNLGHTAGHAFETLAARTGMPVSHGTAVAHGLLVSLILSETLSGLPQGSARTYAERILQRHYHPLPEGVIDTEALIQLMGHDKKNPKQGEVSFVLLRNFGEPLESVIVDIPDIAKALETYSDILD